MYLSLMYLTSVSIGSAIAILLFADNDVLKNLKAYLAARRIKKLKVGQMIFLNSIVEYSND